MSTVIFTANITPSYMFQTSPPPTRGHLQGEHNVSNYETKPGNYCK
jgi:hypothetical protein